MYDIARISLVIAVTYVAGAMIGFQLALTPHSPITLFWPPAGVALAAVLLRGASALPGIFAGAVAVNLLLLKDAPSWPAFTAGIIISASSTVAALLAGRLLRRFAPSAPVWRSASDLLIGSLLMATVCTLPALLGSISLYASGQLPSSALGITIAMWWLGDFCGMAIFSPMFYVIASRTTGNFWRPVLPEDIPLPTALNALASLTALGVFIVLWRFEERAITDALRREAHVSASSLNWSLQQAARDIDSVRAFVAASGSRLNKSDYIEYASVLASGHDGEPDAHRIWWSPRVTDRTAWEARMLGYGADIRIYEVAPQGRLTKVSKRSEYYPVQLIYSADPLSERAIGFDLGSDPVRKASIELARDSGGVSIAIPITLVATDLADKLGIQVCLPSYRPGPPIDSLQLRRERFTGVSCGTYQANRLIDDALANLPGDVVLHLFDQTDRASIRLLYTHPAREREEGPPADPSPVLGEIQSRAHGTADLQFGHKDWLLVTSPGPGLQSSMRSGVPWIAMSLMVILGIVGSSIMIDRVRARRREDAEKRRTEEALAQARSANESKSFLMAAASHDIKQPLFALGFLSDTLLMTDPPESTKPVLNYIKKNIRDMVEHFDSLMDLGRFQQGGFEARHDVLQLSALERRIALEIGPMCRESALDWTIEFADVDVMTDAELLLRLLRNLLINAVRYTDRGEVRCSAVQKGDMVEFRISDTGRGLTPEQLKLIFSDERRLADEEIQSSHLGMGLSIVNKIRRALDLDIRVDSEEAKGTEFRFSIPMA